MIFQFSIRFENKVKKQMLKFSLRFFGYHIYTGGQVFCNLVFYIALLAVIMGIWCLVWNMKNITQEYEKHYTRVWKKFLPFFLGKILQGTSLTPIVLEHGKYL